MPSAPFILQDVPADCGISLRNLAPEIAFGDAYFWSRPEGDVEACNSISVRLITASGTFEVYVALPVFFADVPTPWAGLACIVRFDFFNEYAFLFCYVFQGMSEESVGDAVDFSSAFFAPLAPTLSDASEPFDSDVGVVLFGEFNDFVGYLPHPRLHIISLSSAEPLELETCFTGASISMALKLGSSLLKAELPYRNILTEVCLLQHFILANYGNSYFGAVDVYAHPVRSRKRFCKPFTENNKKTEVSLHNNARRLPSTLKNVAEAFGMPHPYLLESQFFHG